MSGPLPCYLECAMCGADEAFVISKQDPSVGYCFAEKREWTLIEGKNYWPCVTCGTEYTSASNKCSDGCVRLKPDTCEHMGAGPVGVEGDNPAANARLIAAAPALYAALNNSARRVHMSHELHMLHFVTFEECPKESCTEARAALALANTQDTNSLASGGKSSPIR